MKPKIAMIMAAGRGVRMAHLTDDKPKPLVSVKGKTLLDRVLDHIVTDGITEAVVNTCYKADMIEESLSKRKDIHIQISREETALETGGGVVNALPLLLPIGKEGFFVINADPIWVDKTTSVFEQLSAAWNPEKMDMILALIPKERAFGDVSDGNYFIENGKPRRQRPGEKNIPYLYTGIQILHPRVLENISVGVFSLRNFFDKAQAEGRLGYIIYDGDWYHVGTPEAVQETEEKLAE